MSRDKLKNQGHWVFYLLCFVIVWCSREFFFFWDTMQLSSGHAHWFYENGLSGFLLPEHLDSGHIPVFGFYLSSIWSIFGKSLATSHFAMLPFLCLIVWVVKKISNLQSQQSGAILLCLLFSMTSFLGHSILVSPDLALISFLLLSIYGLFKGDKWLVVIGLIFLSVISLRGLIWVGVLLIWTLYRGRGDLKMIIKQVIPLFLPGLILAFAYFVYHKLSIGWVGVHADSPWSESFNLIGVENILKNILIFGWRILDYGFFIIPLMWLLLCFKSKALLLNQWIVLSFMGIFTFAVIIIPFNGLLNPRYFIPIQICWLFGVYEIIQTKYTFNKWKLYLPMMLIMISGHFWIYPKTIAQGWDTTLAHTGFYDHFNNAMIYLDNKGIKRDQVGSQFPVLNTMERLTLNGDKRRLKEYEIEVENYILWSNVMNDFRDEQIQELFGNWNKTLEFNNRGVQTILFERR